MLPTVSLRTLSEGHLSVTDMGGLNERIRKDMYKQLKWSIGAKIKYKVIVLPCTTESGL